MPDSYQLQYSGQQLAKRIGMIPVFYSKWTPLNMPEGWVKSTGAFLQGSQYPEQYAYALKILSGEITNSGISVKSSSGTYDDYDIVINTADETFRLPLLNGTENLPTNDSSKIIDLTNQIELVSTTPYSYTAPCNGWFLAAVRNDGEPKTSEYGSKTFITSNIYIGCYNDIAYARIEDWTCIKAQMVTLGPLYLKKGQTLSDIRASYSSIIDKKIQFIKAIGNGDLWFFLG